MPCGRENSLRFVDSSSIRFEHCGMQISGCGLSECGMFIILDFIGAFTRPAGIVTGQSDKGTLEGVQDGARPDCRDYQATSSHPVLTLHLFPPIGPAVQCAQQPAGSDRTGPSLA
jgi:hypothetical protein